MPNRTKNQSKKENIVVANAPNFRCIRKREINHSKWGETKIKARLED